MNFLKRLNKKGDKITFYYDFGRDPDQRPSAGVFIYTKLKTLLEKQYNKETRAVIKVKATESIIEKQAIGTACIHTPKFKENFLDYFNDDVEKNKRKGNRHLQSFLINLRLFLKKGSPL